MEMYMIEVSIIIIEYNTKELLKATIQSCLNQDFLKNYEIVIVDDGSDDGSKEMIQAYSEKYPDCIKCGYMDRNDGEKNIRIRTSNARRKGFSLSVGKYIVFLDSDDLITSHKLSVQYNFLERNPKYVACYSDYMKFWPNGKKELVLQNFHKLPNFIFWNDVYIPYSCFMFRREVEKNLFLLFVDDDTIVLSIIETGKIYHLSEITFMYRMRENSISHSWREDEMYAGHLLTCQAIRNGEGKFRRIIGRYYLAFISLFNNRLRLRNADFDSFFTYCKKYRYDYLSMIMDFDSTSNARKRRTKILLFQAKVIPRFYHLIRKVYIKIHSKELVSIKTIWVP